MSAPTCTLCKRPAAWRVGDELLCELHKEKAIERFGVDRFPDRESSRQAKRSF